jgi:hypothetical protein
MSKARTKTTDFKFPEPTPGSWKGEMLSNYTVNFGQQVQPGPPRQSVEFSYIVMPATLKMPSGFDWPGIIMIMPPTPMKTEFPDAGSLFRSEQSPFLTLTLQVTRAQFSDMLRVLEAQRLKHLHFTVGDKVDNSWPIHSWGMKEEMK